MPKKQINILNEKQRRFCEEYVANGGNGTQAAIAAGYDERFATGQASRLLRYAHVQEEILRLHKKTENKKIATAQEVMEYFTRVMNGEERDQFGLEASLSERTRAAQELAKRTIDLENRMNGKADAEVRITLDWNMENDADD